MANKRVSELTQISTGDLNSSDLFLLSDVSANESKKLTLGDLNTYILTGGNLTGSFYGTASWANNAQTASIAISAITASNALTASFALNGGTGGVAISASFASASISASYARTASFVSVANAATASFATSSRFADSASFVIYSGGNNGTITNAINAISANTATSASYAFGATTSSFALSASLSSNSLTADLATTASFAQTALFAQTASVGITTNIQTSASWASQSLSASVALTAVDAVFAITASYVLPNLSLQQEGIFLAISQSSYRSQLDKVDIVPFFSGPATTSIEAMGTIIAPYTSSIPLNESVTLYALGRETGIVYTVDSTPIYVNIQGQFSSITASIQASMAGQFTGSISGSLSGQFTGSVSGSAAQGDLTGSLTGSVSASYNGTMTGSLTGSVGAFLTGINKIPFSLMGQLYLPTGSYMFFLTASTDKISIEPTRTARFSVASNIGQFGVNAGEVLQLTTTNTADLITFSSSLGGPFTDTAANIVQSGSTNILKIDISNVGDIRYIWTLSSLTGIFSYGNTLVNDIGGMPQSIVTMSLQAGNLATLYPLSQSSVSILNFANNVVSTFPALPPTMSYINCSSNPLLALPSTIPFGVTDLYAANTQISTPPTTLANSIVSMSLANNSNLNLWLSALPSSLSSFDVSGCSSLTALPTITSNVRYLNVSSCALTDVAQDNICSNLVTNGLLSGSLNLVGNASLLPITLTRIATLQSRAWTVSY